MIRNPASYLDGYGAPEVVSLLHIFIDDLRQIAEFFLHLRQVGNIRFVSPLGADGFPDSVGIDGSLVFGPHDVEIVAVTLPKPLTSSTSEYRFEIRPIENTHPAHLSAVTLPIPWKAVMGSFSRKSCLFGRDHLQPVRFIDIRSYLSQEFVEDNTLRRSPLLDLPAFHLRSGYLLPLFGDNELLNIGDSGHQVGVFVENILDLMRYIPVDIGDLTKMTQAGGSYTSPNALKLPRFVTGGRSLHA